jgi:hypothetical protein
MKRAILTSLLIFAISVGYSQIYYPKSHLNLGIGIGPNYGQMGIKTIIGYKNSGLLIGVGGYPGHRTYNIDTGKDIIDWIIAYEVGGQISYKWWYANLGYGVYDYFQGYWNDEVDKVMKGGIFITGVMVSIGKEKRFFIDAGLGVDWGATYRDYTLRGVYIGEKTYNKLAGVIGFGVRL